MTTNTADLMAKVDVRGVGDCWPWLGRLHPKGYGHFGSTPGVTRHAHRLVYEMLVGPIPEGFQLDHTCHTNDPSCAGGVTCPHRRCVNPAHLEPVTLLENVHRGWPTSHARALASRDRCRHGHPFTDANTYLRRDGGRKCRVCESQRPRYIAARAERDARIQKIFASFLSYKTDAIRSFAAEVSYKRSQMRGPGRRPRTHCQRGHWLVEPNVAIDPGTGHRHCRACRLLGRNRRAMELFVEGRLGGSEDEPDLPLTFVACRCCGHLQPLFAVECEECGAPHPRQVECPDDEEGAAA